MTIAALTNALTGLQASQRALAVVSNNVANANTEGYTKKVAQFESLNFGRSSGGVKIGDIARNVDEFLLRDRRKALGELREIEVAKEFTETVEKLFGTLKEEQSVSALVNKFGTALDDLATFPEDVFNHKRVVDRGQDLIEKLNFINGRLQDLRVQADQEIEADIAKINDILEQIDEYNVQIARAKAVDPAGGIDENLRDKRDVLLNQLSELIDISYFEDANGTVSISTGSGHTLLSIDPVTLHHAAAVAIDKGIRYDPDEIPLTTNDGAIDGIFVGLGRTESDDITTVLLRGRLKGLAEVRDTILPNLQDQLDTLAETMQVEINRIHNLNSAFPPAAALSGTRIFGTYNAVDNSIDVTAAGTQVLSATGHIRISVVTRSPASAAGEAVSTLSIDLDDLRARDYSAVAASPGLNGSAAGQLTVADLMIYINNALGQDGATFPASMGIDGDGNVTLTASNPTTQGVMVHSATQLYRSPAITGPADLNALLGTALGAAASFYVVDGDTQASLNGNAALTFAAGDTYEDVIKAINQIDGVTAGFVHDPGPNGVAGGGDDNFYLEITADDGGTLRFVDTAGTLMTGGRAAAASPYALAEFSLTNNNETLAFAGNGATAVNAAFPLVAAATTFTVYHPDTGEALGTSAAINPGDTIAQMVAALNAIPGVLAIQEEVFTDPAAGGATYSVVRITGTNGETLRITDDAGDLGEDSGLLTTLGSQATAATVTNAQSKAFPAANKTLDRFDGTDTAATSQTLTVTYPNGSTRTITIDPATQTLADVATAINALGAVDGPAAAGINNITLGARIINDNGRKLEVFVQQADAAQSFSGALGFSGTLATTLGMATQDSTNFSHYFGLNDFFVDGNEDSLSQTLAIRPDLAADENLLARGQARNSVMSFTDTGGLTRNTVAIAAGNNQGALDLARVFQTNLTFSAVGDGTEKFALAALNGTLSEYGSRIVSNTGLETRIIEDEAEFRSTVDEELAFRIEGIQGVNLDEEMSDLILFQNAYQASARVISVSQEIMDELIGLVR